MRITALIAAAAVGLAAPVAAQTIKAGVDAWSRGDYKAAVDAWRGPAVAGDADAQFNLGQAYKLGRGVPLDPVLAESWFRKAALQGHQQAEDNYGLALFQSGKKADALPWLEKSAGRGERRAQLVLGTMLFNGDGVSRDYPRAYALMTRASQQGLPSASETLAQMDQYITPADRERGTALAREYATRGSSTTAQPGRNSVAVTDVPPSRVPTETPTRQPQRPPMAERPTAVPVAQQPRPASTRAAPARPEATRPAPAAPAKASAGGSWRVQLGAFSSQSNAEAQWSKVRGRLGGTQPAYVRAGSLIRLQAGGYPTKAAAQRACSNAGVSCVVVAP